MQTLCLVVLSNMNTKVEWCYYILSTIFSFLAGCTIIFPATTTPLIGIHFVSSSGAVLKGLLKGILVCLFSYIKSFIYMKEIFRGRIVGSKDLGSIFFFKLIKVFKFLSHKATTPFVSNSNIWNYIFLRIPTNKKHWCCFKFLLVWFI